MSLTSWFLVSSGGTRHRLPREMIFVGRDDCELMLQSRSVDKQHAVINYEAASDEHKVKDLGSLNGTFVNDVRIQEQMYITLKIDDKLRFGYDTNLFTVVRGELHVPEEALKHEKFTSQLQLTKKPSTTEQPTKALKSPDTKPSGSKVTVGGGDGGARPPDAPKAEDKLAGDIAALHRGTPLYGQPSWWGDGDADDENSFKQESKKQESCVPDGKEARKSEKVKEEGVSLLGPEPSYFEIPTKELRAAAESSVQEVPTKDTQEAGSAPTAGASAAAQGHASFTIEFDDTSPGKVTIRDHVSKCAPDQRVRTRRSPQQGSRELSTLQAAMMASETKVADWLAQNDPPLARRESTEEDSKSIKSDVPMHLKRLKGAVPMCSDPPGLIAPLPVCTGSKHEDGTQSDSENGAGLRFGSRRLALEERLRGVQAARAQAARAQAGSEGKSTEGPAATSRATFMIEFFDEENPRKRRSYSFSQTAPLIGGVAGGLPCPTPPSRPKATISASSSSADGSKGPPSSLPVTGPLATRVLLKQRSEDPGVTRGSASVSQQTSPADDSHRTPRSGEKDHDDDQSDKGTYTIELDNQNPEEEEARRMIDKVFGVEQSTDPARVRPEHHDTLKDWKTSVQGEMKKSDCLPSEIFPEGPVAVGSPRWVSQWATLAANHTRTDPEGSGADSPAFVHQEKVSSTCLPEADASESGVSIKSATSTSSHGERKRRTLPQLPTEDKALDSSRGKPGKVGLRSEIGEKQDTEPQEKESQSDHKGRATAASRRVTMETEAMNTTKPGQTQPQETRAGFSKPPARASGNGEKRSDEGRRKRTEDRAVQGKAADGAEKSGKPLVRQGSFTIEKPSANVPIELIPRINKQPGTLPLVRDRSDSVGSMDTATLLKDTEAVMAFLEAKLRNENKLEAGEQPSYPRAGSISPESDVDTASTVSQAAGDGDRKAAQKRRTLSSLHKEKTASGGSSTTKSVTGARERLDRKGKSRPSESRPEAHRSLQAGSRPRQPSVDLTDDDQTSSLPHSTISDVLSSDQETYSGRSHGRGQFTSTDELLHSKMEASKGSKTAAAPPTGAASAGKPATLPRPRPTRASLLRRARLGDASDTDLADADRVSVASEVSTTSSTSRPPSGKKAPSRIDMLAQPRRNRLGSMSARSDSEATVGRSGASSRGAISAETVLRLGLRVGSGADGKVVPRVRANSVSKLPDAKAKVAYSIHSSPSESVVPGPENVPSLEELLASSRWRRLPPEYASTSEDEFSSSRNSPKHARLRPGTALRAARLGGSVPTTPSPMAGAMKHRMREQEDYIRDWTAHSEEIARLFPCVRRISQDLAKDLAILAREIHDVAGEIDSVSSSGTAPSTTVSTAATTPGSAIDTREEVGPSQEGVCKLVDRVFDESLNFRKIPPVVQTKAPEINGRPVELRPRAPDSQDPQTALRRRTWNRDEAVLDSLLLTSVSQLSAKIRQSVDKTAGKIRILFKDKDRNWEEIESKLRAESDIPLLKTSNKEISSILLELKRVEKQLQVINVMVDPDGTLDALTSLGLTSPTLPKPKTSPLCPQGPGNGASRAPVVPVQPQETERDVALRFSRQHPSGEESPLSHK
ncbi:centrosomal protein of 170 kDa-like isoform X2 [Brienomyrus brachyistius]|uniref:centrosomal protein of 170 kDa-like isoform X2 n=1 Tax=Brienomyrus brachyistius TaxID=42636 RepID=UPI0020B23633|nr:centrosomal protein of 170 kDa-like isoform X2 [Brienomyrus brachyistius]